MHRALTSCFALSAALLVTLLAGSWIVTQLVRADDPAAGAKVAPVETNMHEFMEYVFQPTFRRLKPAMDPSRRSPPGRRSSPIHSFSPDEQLVAPAHAPQRSREVDRNSAAVRDAASQLYKSARQRDFAASRKTYEQMLTRRTRRRCHKQFAGGRHMLTP